MRGTSHGVVEQKTRSARKRYGARAALWGLLSALCATGRDHDADRFRFELLMNPATLADKRPDGKDD